MLHGRARRPAVDGANHATDNMRALATGPCSQGAPRLPQVVPKLCLLLAVMEHCELPHATYLHVVGSCAGMMAAPELFPDERSSA